MSSLPPDAKGAPALKCFTNCQICISGELIPQDLYFSPETGLITPNYYYRTEGVERIDLGGAVGAPGFLDLHMNGMLGIHFSSLGDKSNDDQRHLATIAEKEIASGVTAFWATIPTVAAERWQKVRLLL
jgi:N-acetylglucosamine-6-phosphate deacetylase